MNFKRFSIVLLLALLTITSQAQNPTLAVGLETLTMNKGTIDVEALTEIIMQKQNELKQEALKRFMLSLFPETNYTTKFYVQNCLTILLNEKNPQVIEKEILELTTNYALILGIAKASNNKQEVKELKKFYAGHRMKLNAFRGRIFREKIIEAQVKNGKEKRGIERRFIRKSQKIDSILAGKNTLNYTRLLRLEKRRALKGIKLNRSEMRDDVNHRQVEGLDSLPFGLVVDVVAAALSGMDELKTKGFFKKPIDYKQDRFYLNLISTDEKGLKTTLDTLEKKIAEKIKNYVVHYDVIKEFFSVNMDQTDPSMIPNKLLRKFTAKVIEIAGGEKNLIDLLPNRDREKLGEIVYSAVEKLAGYNGHKATLDSIALTLTQIRTYHKRMQELDNEIETAEADFQKLTPENFKNLDSTDLVQKKNVARDKLQGLYQERDCLPEKLNIALDDLNARKINLAPLESETKDLKFLMNTEPTKEMISNYKTSIDTLNNRVDRLISKNISSMIESGNMLKVYLEAMVQKMVTLEGFKLPKNTSKELSPEVRTYSESVSEIFVKLNLLSKQEVISLKDIRYIDEVVIPSFIKYSVLFSADSTANFNTSIDQFRLLSAFLKISAISPVKFMDKYDKELGNLLGFISNLDNLDKAESYQYMINLLQDTDEKMEKNLEEGKFKDVYLLFSNAVRKYTIVNMNEQYVHIDVVSFLNELTQYFDRNNTSRFGIYATLGLNQNFFPTPVKLPGASDHLANIGFASEKLGVKFRLHSFNRYRGYENTIKTDVNLNKRAPFINEFYVIGYGSGLLYSLANTATDTSFDYAHAGVGFGLRFYNALDINLVAGFPFIKDGNPFKNAFLGIGLDIPLGEYLEKIGSKKK